MRQSRFPLLCGAAAAMLAGAVPAGAQQKVSLTKPDAETAESFTEVSAIRELPSGKVLVADRRDKVVQLVDLASGTMTKVGREGQGPGEYALPSALFGLPTGETLLWDILGRRFLTISADGKPGPIVEPPRPASGGAGGGQVISFGMTDFRGVDGRGRLYLQGSPFSPDGSGADSVPIMRWDRASPKLDTVGYVKSPQGVSVSRSGGNVNVRSTGGKVWSPQETWDVTGDGRIARVTPAPYRVVWFGEARRITAGAVQAYTPIPVTQADRDLYLEQRRRNPPTMMTVTNNGGRVTTGVGGPNVKLPDPEFEETMPPFLGRGSVLATPEGEVWVLRTRPAKDKIPSYDVFDASGALVKKVSLNPESRVVGFGKGTVYVVRRDEDDLQYLERFKRP